MQQQYLCNSQNPLFTSHTNKRKEENSGEIKNCYRIQKICIFAAQIPLNYLLSVKTINVLHSISNKFMSKSVYNIYKTFIILI